MKTLLLSFFPLPKIAPFLPFLVRRIRLVAVWALFLCMAMPVGPAEGTVIIGKDETAYLSNLLAADPTLTLNDILRHGSKGHPATLVMDTYAPPPLRGVGLGDYGILTINSGITFESSNLSNTIGDGKRLGNFWILSPGTINGEGLFLMENNFTAGDGGAVYADAAVIFDVDVKIAGNEVKYSHNPNSQYITQSVEYGGGGGIASNDSLFFYKNATFLNNISNGGKGAGIWMTHGNSTLIFYGNTLFSGNAVIRGNYYNEDYSYGEGGAIAWGHLYFLGPTTLSNNSAGKGGAIRSNDLFFGDNARLYDNSAVSSSGGAISTDYSVLFGANALLSGNTAKSDGGAIYAHGSTSSSVSFGPNAVLDSNTANGNGGVIYSRSITFGDFAALTNNRAGGKGGALYKSNWSGTNIIMGDWARLENNTAGSHGGAIYVEGVVAPRIETTTVVVFGNDAALKNNSSGGSGGAIYMNGELRFGERAQLIGNSADYWGGALLLNQSATFIDQNTYFGDHATLESNTAGKEGGAIYGNKLFFGNYAVLQDNSAKGNGGAAYVNDSISFGRYATLTGNESLTGEGGALYFPIQTVHITKHIPFNNSITFSRNSAAYGGAIFSNRSLGFGDDTTFSYNSAQGGGAIWTDQPLSFGASTTLTGNQATLSDGGAILSQWNKDSMIFGPYTIMSGNSAPQGSGGGVYAENSLVFGTMANFSNNHAGIHGGALFSPYGLQLERAFFTSNTAGFSGGAAFMGGSLEIKGGGIISNNTSGMQGGAFFVGGSSVWLSATAQDLVFSGNMDGTGPNALHLGPKATKVYLSATLGNTLLLADPISNSSVSQIEINHILPYGTVRFEGPYTSFGSGSKTTVNGGTLELADGAIFGNASSVLTLNSGATLASGGNSMLNGVAVLQKGSNLAFDLAASSIAAPLLSLSYFPSATGTLGIDLLNLSGPGTYTLVKNWGVSLNFNPLTLRGMDMESHDRTQGIAQLSIQGLDLVLTLGAVNNKELTWNGVNLDYWDDFQQKHWFDDTSAPALFLHGDTVTFGPSGGTLVRIRDAGVVAGGMTVKGSYLFDGGPVQTDDAASSLASADGKLVIDNGSVNFTRIVGANRFAKGVELNNGTLTLGSVGHLGTSLDKITISGNSTLVFDTGDFIFTAGNPDSQRLSTLSGSNLTLDVQSPATLRFRGSESTNDGGVIYSLGTLTVNGSIRFDHNQTAGSGGAIWADGNGTLGHVALFSHNSAGMNGGAIWANSDLSLGDAAVFSHNSAGTDGGAIWSDGTVTLGHTALFSHNIAGNNGGAIWSDGTVTLDHTAVFTNNSAGMNGGAIWSDSDLSLGNAAVFSHNSAGNNGGALYLAGGTSTLGNNALFSNNLAAGRGGAIYMEGTASLTVAAATHSALFSGNTASGVANAIHMEGGATLNLQAGAGQSILFYDPVTSSGAATVNINNDSGNTGLVSFSGHDSAIVAAATVHGGVFELTNGASWGANDTSGSFTLTGGTLRLGGADQLTLRAATIGFGASGTLSFAPAIHQNASAPILTLQGTTTMNSSTAVNIVSLPGAKDMAVILMQADNNAFGSITNANLLFKGQDLSATRLDNLLLLDNSDLQGGQDTTLLTLTQTGILENYTLNWTGNASNDWNHSTLNWSHNTSNALFMDGDRVIFDASANVKNISILAAGVEVADMVILGGDYEFDGGLLASAWQTRIFDAQRRLSIVAGSAHFKNDLDFFGGYAIAPGAAMTFSGSSLLGDIANDGNFTFAVKADDSLGYAGSINGDGLLSKTGPGRLGLSGIVGQSAVAISDGILGFDTPGAVLGSKLGISVTSGAGVELGSGGVISGAMTMNPGARFSIVGETALRTNGSVLVPSTISAELLTSSGVEGRFIPMLWAGTLTGDFVEQSFSNASNSLQATLERFGNVLALYYGSRPALPQWGQTFNQRSVLRALQGLPAHHPMKTILMLEPDEARAAANLASGEGHISSLALLQEMLRSRSMAVGTRLAYAGMKRSLAGYAKRPEGMQPSAPASGDAQQSSHGTSASLTEGPDGQRVNLWAEATGEHASRKSDGNAADSRLVGAGLALGADMRLENGWLAGAALHGARMDSRIDDRDFAADINSIALSAYAGKEISAGTGVLRLLVGAGYAYNTIDSERSASFPGFANELSASYDAHAWQVFGETAYTLPVTEALVLEPYAHLAWNGVHSSGFAEKGGPAGLKANEKTFSGLTSVLGLRTGTRIHEKALLNLELGWLHEFGSQNQSWDFAFRHAGPSFSIKGNSGNRDAFKGGISLDASLKKDVSFSFGYELIGGERGRVHYTSAQLTWQW